MESEFCAMLHFLFPDELLFLYADADDAVDLVEVLGISTANVGIALSSYTIGLLCVRPFSGFWWIAFRVSLYIFSPSSFLLSCSAGI